MANYFGVFERYSELSGCLSISERVSVMFSSTAQASDRLEKDAWKALAEQHPDWKRCENWDEPVFRRTLLIPEKIEVVPTKKEKKKS